MDLINKLFPTKPKEVHFLKENSTLEKKVKQLEELHQKYPSNNEIYESLKMCIKGLNGENEIKYYLKNSNVGMYVLHDINLAVDDFKAQIDYIVITQSNCYFIECKNMSGKITVDNKGQFIREYKLNGEKIKEAIESPLRQCERHRDILLKMHNKNKGVLDSIFFKEECFEQYHKAIVVFTDKKAILDTRYAPKEIKDRIMRVEELVNYIKKDIKKIKNIDKDSDKSMRDYAYRFLENDKSDEKQENIFNTKCPKCGGELVERKGYSTFLGCSNYPKCDYTRKY